ncbi:MAG: hypothetical protein AB7G93_23000 [Bdellovibrionales bacterium]
MADRKCPRCKLQVSEERWKSSPAICNQCGFVLSSTQSGIETQLERSNLRMVAIVSATVLVGFFHLASWGPYSFEIRMLQLRDLTGFSTVASLERMAQICGDLKKTACVEYAYRKQARLNTKYAVRLAEHLIARKKYVLAASSLKPRLLTHKSDARAAFLYAQAMGEQGKIREAIPYYEYALGATKSHAGREEVVRSYVKHLARARYFQQAQKVILRVRQKYVRRSRYMDSEYRLLAALKSPRSLK